MKYSTSTRRARVFINRLSNPRGLEIYDRKLYYVDVNYESIFSVDLESPQNKVTLKANVVGLNMLRMYYNRHETGNN